MNWLTVHSIPVNVCLLHVGPLQLLKQEQVAVEPSVDTTQYP